jgi:hypothetical protein
MWDWTLDDLLDAHIVLDAIEDAAVKAEAKAREEASPKNTTKVMSIRK